MQISNFEPASEINPSLRKPLNTLGSRTLNYDREKPEDTF